MAAAVKEKPAETKNYRGFVAGVFSGIAKLTGKQKGRGDEKKRKEKKKEGHYLLLTTAMLTR